MFSPPNDLPPICFAFLESISHFVPLILPVDSFFPIPPVVSYWRANFDCDACGWVDQFQAHKYLYLETMPQPQLTKKVNFLVID